MWMLEQQKVLPRPVVEQRLLNRQRFSIPDATQPSDPEWIRLGQKIISHQAFSVTP